MLDGNISGEEDTELRDLVMQTLENNGVLAKVRAKLRASVFLALDEQETVMNPVPLLNKTVKQYLDSSEGRLLFSLVREFLEYFGLQYTINVYDPETYCGKEYNYVGRNKLCEELGINTTEPLLGEILRNSINGAFNKSQKNDTTSNSNVNKSFDTSRHFDNTTFELSVPKVLSKENANDSLSEVQESSDLSLPLNSDRKKKLSDASMDVSVCENSSLREINMNDEAGGDHSRNRSDTESIASSNRDATKLDEMLADNAQKTKQEEISKPKMPLSRELHLTNSRNSLGKTMFFDEIIVDGKKERIENAHKHEPMFDQLPPLKAKSNSIFSNLPPLNGKKEANINDVKQLMERVSDGLENYEEDLSSPSGSTKEQSPSKEPDKSESPDNLAKGDDLSKTLPSDDISEEIDELLTSTSCVSPNNNPLILNCCLAFLIVSLLLQAIW